MDADNFIVNIKTVSVDKDIASDVEKRFNTSNYKVERTLSLEKNRRVIGLMQDELGGKTMIYFVGLRPKTYSYLIDDYIDKNKATGAKQMFNKMKN